MQCLSMRRPPLSAASPPRLSPLLRDRHLFFIRPSPPKRFRVCACASESGSAAGPPSPPSKSGVPQASESISMWTGWKRNAAEMRAQVAKLGLAAILAYGLFDGITYTTFFVLAFLGYEKSTGKNPAANVQALLGIVVLMWTGNNVTRPLRVAGAAALAPFMDKVLRKIQRALNLPNQVFAFMFVVATFAALCLSVIGFLILSRWSS